MSASTLRRPSSRCPRYRARPGRTPLERLAPARIRESTAFTPHVAGAEVAGRRHPGRRYCSREAEDVRATHRRHDGCTRDGHVDAIHVQVHDEATVDDSQGRKDVPGARADARASDPSSARSEEHTSELQSLAYP